MNKIELEMSSDLELLETEIQTEDINVIKNYLNLLYNSLDDCKISIKIKVEE